MKWTHKGVEVGAGDRAEPGYKKEVLLVKRGKDWLNSEGIVYKGRTGDRQGVAPRYRLQLSSIVPIDGGNPPVE